MKIKEAYEVTRTLQGERPYTVGFFWTETDASMYAEDFTYKIEKIRVLYDGTAWYAVREITHLSEPTKTFQERVTALKAGAYVAVQTNGHLDLICKITRKSDGFKIRAMIINGGGTLAFNSDSLTAAKYGNIYKIVCIQDLPMDIIHNINNHRGIELLPFIEQALEFYSQYTFAIY